MNAVERLSAAIEKLEALKAESTQGGWRVVGGGGNGVTIEGTRHLYDQLIDAGDYAASREQFVNDVDPALIVTLHRTIDAQLAILRSEADSIRVHFAAMVNAAGGFDLEPRPFYNKPAKAWAHFERQRADVLDLADAILGGD